MSTLTRHPGKPISELFQWLDLNRPGSLSDLTHFMPMESYTEDGKFVVRADLPGVDPEKDVEVTVDGDILTIHGERHEEQRDNGHSEVRYGSFTRSVRLPKNAASADVTASYDDGVLLVTVPMDEALAAPVKVTVQRAAGPES